MKRMVNRVVILWMDDGWRGTVFRFRVFAVIIEAFLLWGFHCKAVEERRFAVWLQEQGIPVVESKRTMKPPFADPFSNRKEK